MHELRHFLLEYKLVILPVLTILGIVLLVVLGYILGSPSKPRKCVHSGPRYTAAISAYQPPYWPRAATSTWSVCDKCGETYNVVVDCPHYSYPEDDKICKGCGLVKRQ